MLKEERRIYVGYLGGLYTYTSPLSASSTLLSTFTSADAPPIHTSSGNGMKSRTYSGFVSLGLVNSLVGQQKEGKGYVYRSSFALLPAPTLSIHALNGETARERGKTHVMPFCFANMIASSAGCGQ